MDLFNVISYKLENFLNARPRASVKIFRAYATEIVLLSH